ncbi:MAG: 16S rRNA (uracil(1498)-N(3))-methyltransferase [Pseudomonadota bacterium]
MRANYKLQRLHVTGKLEADAVVEPDRAQTNYLLKVLRRREGDDLLVFNGHDGEWRARIEIRSKKACVLRCVSIERTQVAKPDIVFCFAPLKTGRLDYVIQKATEMGVGSIRPVMTEFTQNRRVLPEKMRAWAIEACEQCGVLNVPECHELKYLRELIEAWDPSRALIFCDEDEQTQNPLTKLRDVGNRKLALLIGPEGGFSDAEREHLRELPFVVSIPLGPRILRADTAAVAAMALVQATIGDWR